jgi:segregation and condensation protein A|tara:strand:+ start:19065 stop:19805 length:741 start_codon:yes stop_codon:yes gene_type:complete
MDNSQVSSNSPYDLKLDIFEGPLDLLLTLIKDKNLDIYDISLAEVTEQYLEYVELLKEFNFENIADYLVIAAELARIKSRSLLPKEEVEDILESEDEIDLVEMLKEYKKYRKLSENLNSRNLLGRDIFKRYQSSEFDGPTVWETEKTNIWKLITAVKTVLNYQNYKETPDISLIEDSVNFDDRKEELIKNFYNKKEIKFEEIFDKNSTKEKVIVSFLIILELVKDSLIDYKESENDKITFFLKELK